MSASKTYIKLTNIHNTYFKNTSSSVETPTPMESIPNSDLIFSRAENSLGKRLVSVAGRL